MVSSGNRDYRAFQQRYVIDKMLVHGGSTHTPTLPIDEVNGFIQYVTINLAKSSQFFFTLLISIPQK